MTGRNAHRDERGRRFGSAAPASRPGRTGDAVLVERHQECLSIDARERDEGGLSDSIGSAAVNHGSREIVQQSSFESLTQLPQSGHPLRREPLDGCLKTDGELHRIGPGRVPIGEVGRFQAMVGAWRNEEGGDAAGATEFVCRERCQRRTDGVESEGSLSDQLDGVDEPWCAGTGADRADRFEWLHNSRFVIRALDHDKIGRLVQALGEFIELDSAA